jgi:hypothetical protein
MVYGNKRRGKPARQASLFHIERSFTYYTAKHNKILAFFVKTRLLLFIFVVFRQIAINTNQRLLFYFYFHQNSVCLLFHSNKKKSCIKQDFSFRLFLVKTIIYIQFYACRSICN